MISVKYLNFLQEIEHLSMILVKTKDKSICSSCQSRKSYKFRFSLSTKNFEFPLDEVHYDLWEPDPLHYVQGFLYYENHKIITSNRV